MAVVVQGADALIAKLVQLGMTGAKAAARKGCRAAAKVIAEKFKVTIPSVTGGTRRSIKVRAVKRSRKRVGVRIEVRALDKHGVPYAQFTELGTKKVQARRYEKDAADSAAPGALAASATAMGEEIERRAAQ